MSNPLHSLPLPANNLALRSTSVTLLDQMPSIGLDEMKAVRFMDRIDHKYMASVSRLEELLLRIKDGYSVQRIDGGDPVAPYRTLYFDTPDLAMYFMHHNGKGYRRKVRVRTYRSTGTTFFEVKHRYNNKKTHKVRIPIDSSQFYSCEALSEVRQFLERQSPFTFESLQPCLENSFSRITLVDHGMRERVTIDSGITFRNHATQCQAEISHLLVIEVKHSAVAPPSDIERALHDMHILPRRMSKYCIGTALTNSTVRHNRFKPKLMYIKKITNI